MKFKSERAVYRSELIEAQNKIDELEDLQETLSEAKKLLQDISVMMQEEVKKRLLFFVNRLLMTIFPNPYKLDIEFGMKANRVTASLVFIDRDGNKLPPIGSVGGGVLDVAAFGLRLGVILLSGKSKVLIFDEPFRFLSRERRNDLADVLETICKEAGVQVIMITHHPELEIGKVINL